MRKSRADTMSVSAHVTTDAPATAEPPGPVHEKLAPALAFAVETAVTPAGSVATRSISPPSLSPKPTFVTCTR